MHRELMEIVGILMRVLKGGEVSLAELAYLRFATETELRAVLAEAAINLLEFACQRDVRSRDAARDRSMRDQFEMCLERIAEVCDRVAPAPLPPVSIH